MTSTNLTRAVAAMIALGAVAAASRPALAEDWRNHFVSEIPYRVDLRHGFLNVREGPGTGFKVIDRIEAGMGGLMLRSCSADLKWCDVDFGGDGRHGWVAAKHIIGYAD